jgi:hypothetical protein
MRKLIAVIILTIGLSSCASVPDTKIGIPDRPTLEIYSAEMWNSIPSDAKEIIKLNDARQQNHIKRLEGRILQHDESL